jgi:flagellar transcriptional activator FlhD
MRESLRQNKGVNMNTEQLVNETREINLAYLMLAQQMIREDKASSVFRLGLSEDLAELIVGLTPGQVVKMASSSMLLCRFRYDDRLLLEMLTSYSEDRAVKHAHAAILMAGKPVEQLT